MRASMPKAAVVSPLPSPVWTMSRPRFSFAARILACISTSGQWPYVPDEKNAPQGVGTHIDAVPGIVTLGEYEWADQRLSDGTKTRVDHPHLPLSALGCPADGHFATLDDKIEFLAFYLKRLASSACRAIHRRPQVAWV